MKTNQKKCTACRGKGTVEYCSIDVFGGGTIGPTQQRPCKKCKGTGHEN